MTLHALVRYVSNGIIFSYLATLRCTVNVSLILLVRNAIRRWLKS